MKKIKQKITLEKKFNKLFYDNNNMKSDTIKNKYMITESNITNNTTNPTNNFSKTSFNFNNINNNESKFSHFRKTLFQGDSIKLDYPSKIKLKLKANDNTKDSKDLYDNRYILPYVNNSISSDNKKKKDLSLNKKVKYNKNKFQIYNYCTNKTNVSFNKSPRYKYNKNMISNKSEYKESAFDYYGNKNLNTENNILTKRNQINEENKYKYSLLLKNLESWDKDHCEENSKKSDKNLYNYLIKYYKENNLIEDEKNLNFITNIINSRQDFQKLREEGKQKNTIFIEMIKRKRREAGTIVKNNLFKAKIKFGELFDKKYSKEFEEDLDIDLDTLNLLIEDEFKSVYYNQIIKERIKYEKQLHDELLFVNKIIYEKKNIKVEQISKIKELYIEKNKLQKEFNEKYNKNRKSYWYQYDNYEQYYKGLINNSNIMAKSIIKNKIEETMDNMMKKKLNNNIKINDKEYFKSMSPSKRFKKRLSANEIKLKEDLKKQIKEIEEEKNFKLLHMNHEMNTKLKEMQDNYLDKINKINKEEKIINEQIKIVKLELDYYKKINEDLSREYKQYYMNKLKKGYDNRKEGLSWIVVKLLELQVYLEYHHFPKYLTHEQINYLKKYANLQLKQNELKIIINVLKKKQNTQKMKDVLKCMDVIDNIIEVDNIGEIEEDFNNLNSNKRNNDFIAAKNNINKKFIKLYQDNIDIMKNYFVKNIENYEFYHVINELKKDLYHGSNSNINKSKRDVLNAFMGDKKNKSFFDFLLNIKTNYQLLEDEKDKLFEEQKQNFFKLVESNKRHKASINNVVKNELIKRCLFGTRLDN